jgi:hypothetical protein
MSHTVAAPVCTTPQSALLTREQFLRPSSVDPAQTVGDRERRIALGRIVGDRSRRPPGGAEIGGDAALAQAHDPRLT